MRFLRIATRKSPLARWQANHVASLLKHLDAGLSVSLVEFSTAGDRFLSAPLSAIGGKGLFVKEIEAAVLSGLADLAVHSLKDMTSQIPTELCLAAIPIREDPRDAFVGFGYQQLRLLPPGARIGTSSQRRACQLLERFPKLEIVPLRGNVQSRIQKGKELSLGGVLLALAGLRRLGLESNVTEIISTEVCLPAVGQGALAIECRRADSDLTNLLEKLNHRETVIAVSAERAFLARLGGGCTLPLAGHATIDGASILVQGLVGSPDGRQVLRAKRSGSVDYAEELGRQVADALIDAGGRALIDQNQARV